ncbi:MAG: sortase [Candidatus Parcubacteria bacterium]|jgi:LPXTG-site transpeptidase (sortase) family protein|nr:sortase [Candidatus Parcubacteria bacterium]
MRFKYDKQAALGAAALVAVVLVVLLSPQGERLEALLIPRTPAVDSVERLKIPSLGVDAAIERVALTPAGAMDTPDGPQNVGWYSPGPYPGQEGSAVIAGHRGWKNGEPAVFDDLDRLRKGDVILVVDPQGNELPFVVHETRVYEKGSIAPEVFTSASGTHLNLITCVGTWDSVLRSTEERLVVFADLAS